MKHLFLFGLVLILTGCSTPGVSTPAPTPEAINIIYPSALQPWADDLARCASNNPQIALYFMQSSLLGAHIQSNEIGLELGNPANVTADTYLSQVGWEQVVVVVNTENSLSQLTDAELRSIFSGQASISVNNSGDPIQVWVFPEGDPTRLIFDLAVMQEQPVTTAAMLAPDPGAMLETISENIGTIGYLPGSFLATVDPSIVSKVKIIQLEPILEAQLRQPVIAITQSEPTGLLRSLLVCLESTTP
jgi:hypothetical protein